MSPVEGAGPIRILFVAHIGAHFTELARAARMLGRRAEYRACMFFARPYAGWESHAASCVDDGIRCIDPSGREVDAASNGVGSVRPVVADPIAKPLWIRAARSLLERLPRRAADSLRDVAGRLLATNLIAFAQELRSSLRGLRRARQLMRAERVHVLVIAEDGVEYGTAILVRAAHEAGIPSVVLPFTVVTALEPAEAYAASRAHQLHRWSNRLYAKLRPHWVYSHRGRRLLRLPAGRALAQELLGVDPPRPWVLNSGKVDRVAVESPFMLQHYLQEGLPEGVLRLTGSLADDVLAEHLVHAAAEREALFKELGLPAGRSMLLCALPTNQLAAGRPECDFSTYDDLLSFWLTALSELETCNSVVTLHPRVRDLAPLCSDRPGVAIVRSDTAALVPLCDVFVASVSATIRWALACSKPTVNYDVYRYRYVDYVDAGGILTVEGREEFRQALRLALDEARRGGDLARRAAEDAPRWGNLDGKAGERLQRMIGDLVLEFGIRT